MHVPLLDVVIYMSEESDFWFTTGVLCLVAYILYVAYRIVRFLNK